MKLPELLAPAGGMDQLKAAVRFGADAVYGGMQSFGLRAFAGNFTWDSLPEALEVVHRADKKFYLTLNVLPYEDELDSFIETARRARECGVDAAIVSDLGAIVRLRREVPQLPIHVSTQANTMNAETCRFYSSIGVERVVPARELSLQRVKAIAEAVPEIEIEAFVHGAMCMSHSGRCMLSDHLTGRGGNRGACAQSCRWEYALMEEKRPGVYFPVEEDERGTYILSAYDLNMMAHLPEMIQAGIKSLKIEGRMKTEFYVASVVSAYRTALNLLAEEEEKYLEALPELLLELDKSSHRISNTGFYFGRPTPESGAGSTVQSMEYVGKILGVMDGMAQVLVKNRFYVGDRLELLSPEGVKPFTVDKIIRNGQSVDTVHIAGEVISLMIPHSVGSGDFLRGINRTHVRKE